MTIKWLHENQELVNGNQLGSPFITKLLSQCEDEGRETFTILATNRNIATALISSFAKLNDAFPTLNIRFGWTEEGNNHGGSIDICSGISMVVGEDNLINSFMKVSKVKSLYMTNRAQNELLHLGFQRHLAPHSNPYSISLGELRYDITEAETAIRSAPNIAFYMGVMRREDSGSASSHTAGIDIYDSCKLMRLAGMSKQLQFIGINTESDQISEKTADAISLLVWYFTEGQINKEIETMKQRENDVFLVSTELFDEPIKFVVGHKTGRWWYQHPATKEYVPCSDKDYNALAVGNLPDSLVSLQN